MIFQLLRLWWYCWKNDIYFKWETSRRDKTYYEIYIENEKNHRHIMLFVSKHPCRKSYAIYNRIRYLIYHKLIKNRDKIKCYNHDFGLFKIGTCC